VSNNLISCWDSERVYLRRRDTLVASLEHLLMSPVFLESRTSYCILLGTAADITHEALFIGVDLLDLAPVPGLRPAAQLLLNIWDASQQVDVSFMPLTNRRHQFN
jgi:hypothetical protein